MPSTPGKPIDGGGAFLPWLIAQMPVTSTPVMPSVDWRMSEYATEKRPPPAVYRNMMRPEMQIAPVMLIPIV